MTEKIKAQVLGQDAFVSALVKAFRRPFVLGTADDTAHARSVMLLCGPNGTGRHYALQCVVDELAARGVLHSAAVETLDLALYPGPAQEKLFCRTFTRRCSPTPRCWPLSITRAAPPTT
ncbi:hypothetical protein NIA69_08900 [Gemmiger formicilis]|nr:hypothetical protein [Gemmiger formicilis]